MGAVPLLSCVGALAVRLLRRLYRAYTSYWRAVTGSALDPGRGGCGVSRCLLGEVVESRDEQGEGVVGFRSPGGGGVGG